MSTLQPLRLGEEKKKKETTGQKYKIRICSVYGSNCFSLFLFPAVITSPLLHLNSYPSKVQPSTHSVKFYLLMVKGMTSELLISVRSPVFEGSCL